MEAVLFTTAEYASISQDGKLSIGGIFDSIQAETFPANSPRMFLVAQFRAQPEAFETAFEMRFQLFNEDGEQMIDISGAGEVPTGDYHLSVLMNQVVTLNNVSFQEPGHYTFTAELDGEQVASIPFRVVQMQQPG